MKISRPLVVSSIFSKEPDSKTRSIVELSLESMEIFFGRVEPDHEVFINRFRQSILNDLLEFDEVHKKHGGIKSFVCVDRSKLLVRWADMVRQDHRIKVNLRNRALVYLWIHDLSDRQYEYLGAALMKILGASEIALTPRGNECGIDFMALVPAYSRSELFVSGGRGVRVVGQSKLYKSRVPRSSIQSFNNLMDSIRHNKYEIHKIVPAWFRNSPAPLMGLWAAHNGYQEGARILSEQNGHILLNTLMIAEVFGSAKALQNIATPEELERTFWSYLAEFEVKHQTLD